MQSHVCSPEANQKSHVSPVTHYCIWNCSSQGNRCLQIYDCHLLWINGIRSKPTVFGQTSLVINHAKIFRQIKKSESRHLASKTTILRDKYCRSVSLELPVFGQGQDYRSKCDMPAPGSHKEFCFVKPATINKTQKFYFLIIQLYFYNSSTMCRKKVC